MMKDGKVATPTPADKIKKDLYAVLEDIKWKLPDTPEKFKTYQAVQESILWLSAVEIFKDKEE